jgi:CRP/FNR family transcriptional regulator, cyclic AMP receptor protein
MMVNVVLEAFVDKRKFEGGSFLASIPEEHLRRLLSLGRRRVFLRGRTLLTQGEHPSHVIALIDGRVKVAYYVDDGREVLLEVRGAGDLLGVLYAIDGGPVEFTITAIETCEVVAITAQRFRGYLETDPDLARWLLQTLSRRLRARSREHAELAVSDTLRRVAARLVDLADRYGKSANGRIHIDLPLSQGELAAWTGASREATSRALHTLRQRQYIETNRREIVVLDLSALRSRAASRLGD